ncbi:hypothetical protein FM076_09630 [Streptomyces albus subsp. chlorinus]|uniref:hypothetical protein n=1 Tax=Streptomyces albus TaxID=1888 RepID=UPI0015701DB8|nr:hypothetical protein [Streptomyces albus]NSC21450.1 hypothetical protein [Streptomyces albus subsp. chlorinus]
MSEEPEGSRPAEEAASARAARAGGAGGRLGRLVRGRAGAGLAGAVVGALLAAGVLVWRAGELPFLPRDVCWGSLSPEVVDGIGGGGDVRARQLPLEQAATADSRTTQCRIEGWKDDERRWQVTAEVRALDRFRGRDGREWADEFLSPRMAPLGGEVTGMVSDSRAWAALPASCTGAGDGPPTVVTLAAGNVEGNTGSDPARTRSHRAGMARAVVALANGVKAEKGCEGRYAPPRTDALAPLPRTRVLDGNGPRELCGLKGARLPEGMRGSERYPYRMRAGTHASGPAHSCEVGLDFPLDGTRFTTVEDPRLARAVEPLARRSSVRFKGEHGYGALSGDLAVYAATCRTGQVVFMARTENYDPKGSTPLDLLPSYVRAESKRIGCGEETVRMPRLPSVTG